MDVIEHLIAGHREVFEKKDFLDKLAAGINNDAFFWDNAPKVANFFDVEVRKHFEIEEKVLFPLLREVFPGDKRGIVDNIELEHEPILRKVNELVNAAKEHSISATKVTRVQMAEISGSLLEMLVPHAHKEDVELFPLIKKHFKPESFERLEQLYFKYIGA